jgi:hypothetical protein
VSKVVAASSPVWSTPAESTRPSTATSDAPDQLAQVPTGLLTVLAQVVDPRKRRGMRHRLAVVGAIAIGGDRCATTVVSPDVEVR